MKVIELIKELQALHDKHGNLEVTIVDGYNYRVYKGAFEIAEFEGVIDIGVGGLIVEDD